MPVPGRRHTEQKFKSENLEETVKWIKSYRKYMKIGIIPVIAIDDADKAVPLAQALVKGGLPAAEVTFRTAAGEEAIRRIVNEVPDMLVGAGTVLTTSRPTGPSPPGPSLSSAPASTPWSPATSSTRACP